MSHTLTIAGKSFNVEPRYGEGHQLTANEAAALNQTYFENLRNNFASRVKESPDADLQAEFDEYAASYQFGVRTGGGGGRVSDPVEAEALDIARSMVRDAIKKQPNIKLADVKSSVITETAQKLLAGPQGESIREVARQRVAQRNEIAQSALGTDILGALSGAEPSGEAAPAKRKKSAAA